MRWEHRPPYIIELAIIALLSFVLFAMGAAARAEDDDQTAYLFPVIPSEEHKIWALKRAYQLNGNSMVGNNVMIDVSRETPFSTPVKTERVPLPAPAPEARVAQVTQVADICTRHGKRRVAINGGRSWRCR
jgi:hypothetical protein